MDMSKMIAANNALMLQVKEMDIQDKTALFSIANAYTQAKRTGGDAQKAFTALLATVQAMEKKYAFSAFAEGVPPATLLDAFAAAVEKGTAKVAGPKTYTCQLGSIEEANRWLGSQRDIVIKKMSMNAGGAGNQINSLTFEFVVNETGAQKIYQVTELKKTRLYAQSKVEKVREQWQKKNPQFTYVTSVKKHWAYSLIGGRVGYFRLVNEKYVILYTYNNV